ncbi:MAG: hypothetical protein JWN51_972 [Phycisphaerales bacterium]|jgi:hypothetical protein|nr:hypothetical protein [Phycisphaerales bacterium]
MDWKPTPIQRQEILNKADVAILVGCIFVPVGLVMLAVAAFYVRSPDALVLGLAFFLVGCGSVPAGFRKRRELIARMRHQAGYCPHCGYNLTGNTSGVCPECGGTIGAVPEAEAPAPKPSWKQVTWFFIRVILVGGAWLTLGQVRAHGFGWALIAFFALLAMWIIWSQARELKKSPRSIGSWVGLIAFCAFATWAAYKVIALDNLRFLGVTFFYPVGRPKPPHTPQQSPSR